MFDIIKKADQAFFISALNTLTRQETDWQEIASRLYFLASNLFEEQVYREAGNIFQRLLDCCQLWVVVLYKVGAIVADDFQIFGNLDV